MLIEILFKNSLIFSELSLALLFLWVFGFGLSKIILLVFFSYHGILDYRCVLMIEGPGVLIRVTSGVHFSWTRSQTTDLC